MTSEALNRDFFDDDIRASDDLFRHVNGAWLARAKIPEDRSGWGAFYELREASEAAVRQIIETRDAEGEGADAARIANLYASFMDTEAVEKLGIAPLRALLDKVDQITSTADLARFWGWSLRHGIGGLLPADCLFECINAHLAGILPDKSADGKRNYPARYRAQPLMEPSLMPLTKYFCIKG